MVYTPLSADQIRFSLLTTQTCKQSHIAKLPALLPYLGLKASKTIKLGLKNISVTFFASNLFFLSNFCLN